MYKASNYDHLFGTKGLSDKLLDTHFKLYKAYVKNTNTLLEEMKKISLKGEISESPLFAELKRRFGWEFNGMRLHEYYFENMVKRGKRFNRHSSLAQRITADFGNFERWERDFKATGGMRGIGWVILYFDPRSEKLFNCWVNEHDMGHLAGAVPLLIMDVFEHAFMLDYGINRKSYIDAFFRMINWDVVVDRLESVEK